jgi:hypothetical protein
MLGESMNMKNLAELLFNQEGIRQQQMMQQQQGQPAQQAPGQQGIAGGPQGLLANPGQFNTGLGPALGNPSPQNPVFPTTRGGTAKPVSPKHNGPKVGPGTSPLPASGMPKTRSVGL